MWFGEPHPFPVRGSPTRLSASAQQSYEGWSCRLHKAAQKSLDIDTLYCFKCQVTSGPPCIFITIRDLSVLLSDTWRQLSIGPARTFSCPSNWLVLHSIYRPNVHCNWSSSICDTRFYPTDGGSLFLRQVGTHVYQTARYHNSNPAVWIFTAVQTPYLKNFIFVLVYCAVAHLVEALRYNFEGRRFNFRWCHWNFSFT